MKSGYLPADSDIQLPTASVVALIPRRGVGLPNLPVAKTNLFGTGKTHGAFINELVGRRFYAKR